MRRMIFALAALVTAAFSVLGAVAPASASVSGCAGTSGCAVYKLTAITTGAAANVSPNGVALGSGNNPVAGDHLELRNFATTRASEQFVLASNGELQLGGTSLCVTGFAQEVVLDTCSAPVVWNSQNWTFTDGVFTNARSRSLFVTSLAAYTTVQDSTTSHASWAQNPA